MPERVARIAAFSVSALILRAQLGFDSDYPGTWKKWKDYLIRAVHLAEIDDNRPNEKESPHLL